MITIKTLPEFDNWLNGLRDGVTKKRLRLRLKKVAMGNLGDVKIVSGNVGEMREHFGPGWRMYYTRRDEIIVIMLGGGDKSTQEADINLAITLEKNLGN